MKDMWSNQPPKPRATPLPGVGMTVDYRYMRASLNQKNCPGCSKLPMQTCVSDINDRCFKLLSWRVFHYSVKANRHTMRFQIIAYYSPYPLTLILMILCLNWPLLDFLFFLNTRRLGIAVQKPIQEFKRLSHKWKCGNSIVFISWVLLI